MCWIWGPVSRMVHQGKASDQWQRQLQAEGRRATVASEAPAKGIGLVASPQHKAGWCLARHISQADVWEGWHNMVPEGLAISFRDSLTQGLEVSLEVFRGGSRQKISKEGQDINLVNGTGAQLQHRKWARVMTEQGQEQKWWGWPTDLLTKGSFNFLC